jgi:adenosylhomocysteine nucleosidase
MPGGPRNLTEVSAPAPVACRGLVCFAVKEEARFFETPIDCKTVIHGMGRATALSVLERVLPSLHPRLVLTCGFAGGLDPDLRLGSILFEVDAALAGASELASQLESLGARCGRFHCASRVAVTALEKQELRRSTGADAVEMESSAILSLCRERGLLAATLRVISDEASEDLPLDFNRVMTRNGGIHWARLAGQLIARPGKIPKLIQLQKDSTFAARQLGELLQQLLLRIC